MGRAAIPGPLGTETRQTMFAPEAVQPGISMLSEPAVWDSPTPLRDRLERELPLADEAEQGRLALEKQRIAAERNRIRPTYKIVSRRSGAPGS